MMQAVTDPGKSRADSQPNTESFLDVTVFYLKQKRCRLYPMSAGVVEFDSDTFLY